MSQLQQQLSEERQQRTMLESKLAKTRSDLSREQKRSSERQSLGDRLGNEVQSLEAQLAYVCSLLEHEKSRCQAFEQDVAAKSTLNHELTMKLSEAQKARMRAQGLLQEAKKKQQGATTEAEKKVS